MAVAALVLVLAACSGGAVTTVSTTGPSVTGTTDDAPVSTGSTGSGSRSAASSTTTPQSTTSTTTSASGGDAVEIVIENGEVVGGSRTLAVALGDVVHLLVVADTEDHVHVHGYDLFFELVPGSETEIMFTADVAGIFEIELEGSHLLLIELDVS